jgi:hypothetical protein
MLLKVVNVTFLQATFGIKELFFQAEDKPQSTILSVGNGYCSTVELYGMLYYRESKTCTAHLA